MEPVTTALVVALVKEQIESGILDTLKEKAIDEIVGVLVKNAVKMTADAKNQGWWQEKAKWFTKQKFAHDWITKSVRRILDSECNWARAIIERVYMRCLIEERDLSYEERVIVKGCPQLTDRQINMLVILLKAKFPGEAISIGEFEGNIWAYKKELEGLSGLERANCLHICKD